MKRIYTALLMVVLVLCCVNSFVMACVPLKVTGDHVNLRAIADGESEVVAQVSRGDIVYADSMPGSNEWVKIAIPAGKTVWVYSELVKNNVVSVSRLSVRSGPGINYRTVGMLNKGERVVPHGVLHGWLKIDAPERCRVFISNKYVIPVAGAETANVVKKTVEPVKQGVPENIRKHESVAAVVPVKTVSREQKKESVPAVDVAAKKKIKPTVNVQEVVSDEGARSAFPVTEPEDIIPLSGIIATGKSNTVSSDKSVTNITVKKSVTNSVVSSVVTNDIVHKPRQEVMNIIQTKDGAIVTTNTVKHVDIITNKVAAVVPLTTAAYVKQQKKPAVSNFVAVTENRVSNTIVVTEVIETPQEFTLPPANISVATNTVKSLNVITEDVKQDKRVKPEIIKTISVKKSEDEKIINEEIADYAAVISNDIPACISPDRIDYSYEQGCSVVLNGKVIHISFSAKHNPWSYRLVNGRGRSALNCYLVAPGVDIKQFDDKLVRVKGKVYWLKGVKHEVIVIDDIKMIPALPVLP